MSEQVPSRESIITLGTWYQVVDAPSRARLDAVAGCAFSPTPNTVYGPLALTLEGVPFLVAEGIGSVLQRRLLSSTVRTGIVSMRIPETDQQYPVIVFAVPNPSRLQQEEQQGGRAPREAGLIISERIEAAITAANAYIEDRGDPYRLPLPPAYVPLP